MANPICLSPLKFYDSKLKQNHRKSYAYGHISPLIMKLNILDSFQFVLLNQDDRLIEAYIYNARTDEDVTGNIYGKLLSNGLMKANVGGYNIITYPGLLPITDIVYEGEYYLVFKSGFGSTYYSEIFCFTNSLSDCLELQYGNPEGYFYIKGGIIDLTNINFVMRLKSELGKPEYKFEEEATKRLGQTFIESQVSSKIYKFNTVIPEYLCDALRIVRLCSTKIVKSKNEVYDLQTFDMEVDWQEQGDLASVTCEFQVDNIIVNLGGYLFDERSGDFNRDYNIDFDIQ